MAERPSFDNTAWLDQVAEDVVDPERRSAALDEKMAARYSEAEQDDMFSGTAIRVYRLDA